MPQMRAVMSGHLGEAAPAQEGLEEARRLVDAQAHVLDAAVAQAHVQRALALDAGERLGDELAHQPTR